MLGGALSAARELSSALRLFPLWLALGTIEIRHRYQRSLFGPFWITINIAAMVFGIGYIYANIFNSIRSSYIPYLAVGIIFWNFISASVTEGSHSLIQAGAIIRNVTISRYIHVFHCLWRNVIILLHNLLILIPVYLIYGSFPGWKIVEFVPCLLLLIAFLTVTSLLVAVLSTRFRDIPPGIASILQVSFFATPILWEASSLNGYRWVILLNPFYHLIECVRAPLLGGGLPVISFITVAAMTLAVAVLMLVACAKTSRRLIFWL
jgi:ABC-type polysaccharide/polyol phosphate export permease